MSPLRCSQPVSSAVWSPSVCLGLLLLALPLQAAPPPSLSSPADMLEVRHAQQAWATELGLPVEFTNSLGMKLRLIPPGDFLAGSSPNEAGRDRDESARAVVVRRPFYLAVHEVTQQQYQQLTGQQPSRFSAAGAWRDRVDGLETGRFPVDSVSWQQASLFCRRLTASERATGLRRRYRLPTEIEWEYACRAGSLGSFSPPVTPARLLEIANYRRPGQPERPWPVGSLAPNSLGLFDMHGNVWEWCQDWYQWDPALRARHRTTRVIRGGGWYSGPARIRSAERVGDPPSTTDPDTGFRLLMDLPAMHLPRSWR